MTLIAKLRAQVRRILDQRDARLADSRRELVRGAIEEIRPNRVLFICLGNICRSPYAERFAKRHVAVEVDSSGFIGPGRPPPEHAQAVARARGIDHSDHCSKTVTQQQMADADLVFIFDRYHVKRLKSSGLWDARKVYWLGDLDPSWPGSRAIHDPWGKELEDFEAAFQRIERCVLAFAELASET